MYIVIHCSKNITLIKDIEEKYVYSNFLLDGDLVNIKINESNEKSVIAIYSEKNGVWKRDTIYELDKKIIRCGITNDKLWMLSNQTIFILNLSTLQYRKIPLEIDVSINYMIFSLYKS